MVLDYEWGCRPAKGSFLFYCVTNPLRNSRNTLWLPWNHSAWIVKCCQDGHRQSRPRWQHGQQWLRSPIPDFYNFWQDFTKKLTHRNLLRTLMNKTQENHPQKARPRTHSDRRNSFSKSAQNWPPFHKTDTTRLLNGLRSTKPRNFRSKNQGTRLHAPP